jgi:hypothetical protein
MRNSSNDSQFDDILDELSNDDFEGIFNTMDQRTSWHSELPMPEENKSPVTPLISNRKVLSEDLSEMNEPPPPSLVVNETEREGTAKNGSVEEDKALHSSNVFDPSVEEEAKEKLRCVGIELDESLANRARNMVTKALTKYQHEDFCPNLSSLQDRVFIRCADILDEWIRDIDSQGNHKSAEHLTLLDDATAVFVYLSPEGLKKVKPLLFEASLRRRRTQRELNEMRRTDSVQQWKDMLGQIHKKQPEVLDELELLELEDKIPIDSIISKGHQSRISDITTCESVWEGRCCVNSDGQQFDHCNKEEYKEETLTGVDCTTPKLFVGSPLTINMQSTISSLLTSASLVSSPFRIVSYMHPIPGWRATRIDRSSCGNCPLFYYEDVDLQNEY